MMRFSFEILENIVDEEENAGHQNFFLYNSVSKRLPPKRHKKYNFVWFTKRSN